MVIYNLFQWRVLDAAAEQSSMQCIIFLSHSRNGLIVFGIFFSVKKLAEEVKQSDANHKKKYLDESKPGFGYGGKFGVESDRMDKCAMGNDYASPLNKHESQKDYKVGFGGSFGVQTDRLDKVIIRIRLFNINFLLCMLNKFV